CRRSRGGGGRGGIVIRGLRRFVACGTCSAAQGLHRGVCMSMVLQIMCTIGSVVYDVVIGCRRARDTHLDGVPWRFGGATVDAGRMDGRSLRDVGPVRPLLPQRTWDMPNPCWAAAPAVDASARRDGRRRRPLSFGRFAFPTLSTTAVFP